MKSLLIATLMGAGLTASAIAQDGANPSPQNQPATEQLLALTVGVPARAQNGATLVFSKVLSDSRCPKNAQCVWAGELRIELTAEHQEKTEVLDVGMMEPAPASWGAVQIENVKDCGQHACAVQLRLTIK